MRLALYQTEIAQNVGTMIRLAACFGVAVDIIEPTGFPWNNSKMRRAGMDYIDLVKITKHKSFEDFRQEVRGRLILLDTKASTLYTDVLYQPTDTLMVGRESCGVPKEVFAKTDLVVKIPMERNVRSLNVALAAAIGLSEAIKGVKLMERAAEK
jgi:tRNA (cytidine/uridine-2'-O-)-methyltransferase